MQRDRKHLYISFFFIMLLVGGICLSAPVFGLTMEEGGLLGIFFPSLAATEANSQVWLPILVTGSGSPTTMCLNRPAPAITLITGAQAKQYNNRSNPLAQNAVVEANSASWTHVDDYPVVVSGGPDTCFSGGAVTGEYLYSETWERMHDTTAFTFRTTGRTIVENIRIHNYGDGISFSRGSSSDSFHITGAHLTHIRDDCVQNDYMYGGKIDDSFFDGCYTAFSAQTHGRADANDGSQNVWIIRNSLVRLEPMEKVYNDQGLIPGHGAFFKWSLEPNSSPRLALHNNVFRADQPSNSSSGLRVPVGKLSSCSNNVMVWLGEGPFPDELPETFDGEPCFTITTDIAVWDKAVQDWLARRQYPRE